MNGTEVVANDLLLNITGGSLGRCAIIPSNFDKGNVSQHVCILRTVLVKPDYLHAFILSSFFANSMKITGSGREGLPKYNLEKMLLPLPPIKEQERIISETERLQTFVDQIEISEGKLSEFILQAKSKILDLAIHGKLVPQDPTDKPACELLKRINPKAEITCDNPQYGKLPNGWCLCNLASLCKIKGGKRIPRGRTFSKGRTPHIYIRVSDMKNNTIMTTDLKYIDDDIYQKIKNYTISSSDLYLTIAGTIGAVGIVPTQFNGMNLTENAAKLTSIICDKKISIIFIAFINSARAFQVSFSSSCTTKIINRNSELYYSMLTTYKRATPHSSQDRRTIRSTR